MRRLKTLLWCFSVLILAPCSFSGISRCFGNLWHFGWSEDERFCWGVTVTIILIRWDLFLRQKTVWPRRVVRAALCVVLRPNCGFPFFRKDFLSYLAQAGGWGWLQGGGAALHLSREEQCTTSRKWRDVEEKGWIRVQRESRYHPSVRWPLSTCRIPRKEEDWGGL